jgi:hypothetical protein
VGPVEFSAFLRLALIWASVDMVIELLGIEMARSRGDTLAGLTEVSMGTPRKRTMVARRCIVFPQVKRMIIKSNESGKIYFHDL